jgi:hypothetical protein
MSISDHKIIKIRVNKFDKHHFVWDLNGYIRREGSDEIELECFLDDKDPVDMTARLLGMSRSVPQFRPISPEVCPPSPPLATSSFQAHVHDTRSWGSTATTIQFNTPDDCPCPSHCLACPPILAAPPPLVASPEPEEEEDEPIAHNPRKRGRPRGSKNRPRGDEAWRRNLKKGPRECSARVLLDNLKNNLECQCCCVNSQLLVKCSNNSCDIHLCMECIKRVEKRFEGVCPYCRLQF